MNRCVARLGSLLISTRDSASGYPLAVMGPQVSYFTPQILMEEDIHGPGIDADGAAFAGVNLYVELGHGQDYAWSATSSDQNIIDTFVGPLCNPSGGAALGELRLLPAARPVRGDADADRPRVVEAEPGRSDAGRLDHPADPAHRLRDRDRPRAGTAGRPSSRPTRSSGTVRASWRGSGQRARSRPAERWWGG